MCVFFFVYLKREENKSKMLAAKEGSPRFAVQRVESEQQQQKNAKAQTTTRKEGSGEKAGKSKEGDRYGKGRGRRGVA